MSRKPLTVVSLFDGCSTARLVIDNLGHPVHKYYASEIDTFATKVSKNNYPDIIRVGDVLDWKSWDIDWASVDLIVSGSPCQGFSLQGDQLGFEDPRSVLYFAFEEVLKHVQELNPNVLFMLENVHMKQEFRDIISNRLDVEPVTINSVLRSCQSRKRWYWSNVEIDIPTSMPVPPWHVVHDRDWKPATTRKGDPRKVVFTGDTFGCLTATYYKGIRADGRPSVALKEGNFDDLKSRGLVRMLLPEECERLQEFPTGYTKGVSNTQRYKMLGNAWTVSIIEHIFKILLDNLPPY